MHVKQVAALFALLMVSSSISLAGPGIWTSSGPEGGNVMRVEVSAAQPERMYLTSEGGIFRSDNEGQSWQEISAGLPQRFSLAIAVSNSDPDRVYASFFGGQLFRSDDAGSTWQQQNWPAGWGRIVDMHIDPADPDRITVTGDAESEGSLRRSLDGGQSWSRIDAPGTFSRISSFLSIAGTPEQFLVLAIAEAGDPVSLYRSVDAGSSWSELDLGQPVLFSSRFFANDSDTILLLPGHFISSDGGESFEPLMLPDMLPLAAVPHPTDSDAWYIGGRNGLVFTDDGAETFSVISDGMAPSGSGGYNAGVTALALKPGTDNVLLVGSQFTGFYRSPDAGASWQRRNSGLRGVNIRSLAVNPVNNNIIYAGQSDSLSSLAENVWSTFDGGASWSPANAGLEAGGVRGLALDPNTAGSPPNTVLYGVGWSLELFDVSMPARGISGGAYKTTSGGFAWQDIGADLPLPAQVPFSVMRTVVLDPSSGSGGKGDGPLQTVFIGGNGFIDYSSDPDNPMEIRHRVYRSDDAGASWTPADNGMPIPPWNEGLGAFSSQVIQLHINPDNPQTLYATTILGGQGLINAGITPELDNGVFRSTDGGTNWTLTSAGLPRFDPDNPNSSHWNVLAMAIAPSQPERLFAVASPIGDFWPSLMFRSDDGGDSWTEFGNGIPDDIDIRWIEVDPFDPDVVYAAGGGTVDNPGSVFRSENGGVEWVSYSVGLPADSATMLAIDRSGPNPIIHAGTRSGVFSIEQVPDEDIDGVPDDIEDGAPNGGDGNGDGLPDSLQPEVASLLAPSSGRSARRGVSEYITVELVEKGRSQCSRLMSAHALGSNAFPLDPGYEYPYGLLRFEIPDCPGAAIRIIFHDLAGDAFDGDWVFRVFAPDVPGDLATVRWQAMPDTQADGNAWILSLSDGELGDLRPANNRILFQGGPALLTDNRIFSDRFEEPN